MFAIRISRSHVASCFTVLTLLAMGSQSHAQSVEFDGFDHRLYLDPDKWFASQYQSGSGAGLELVRELRRNELFLSHRVVGAISSARGSHLSGNQVNLRIETISAIQFDVSVWKFNAGGCPEVGSDTSYAIAAGVIALFNDGRGDVRALIEARRESSSLESPSYLRLVAYLTHDVDQTFAFQDLGRLRRFDAARLRMQWDPTLDRVIFQVDSQPVVALGYLRDDSRPPVNPIAALGVVGWAANCTVQRQVAEITATFDNVFMDP